LFSLERFILDKDILDVSDKIVAFIIKLSL